MNAPWDGRCEAAHVADPRPCDGQRDAVRIVDRFGAGVEACVLHGAVLLASLDRGKVYLLHGPDGSAITVYTRAGELAPFDFLTGPGVTGVATAGEAADFPYGPDPKAAVFPPAPELVEWVADPAAVTGPVDGCRDLDVPGNTAGAADEDGNGNGSDSAITRADGTVCRSCSEPGNAGCPCWGEATVSAARGDA